jgi:hypothetical protein
LLLPFGIIYLLVCAKMGIGDPVLLRRLRLGPTSR